MKPSYRPPPASRKRSMLFYSTIMKDGKLLALGTAEELKAKAGTEKVEDAFVAIVKGAAK